METRPRRKPHILVADNEPAIGHLLTALLADEGYHVTVAGSVQEACAFLAQTRVDLVLTDSFTSHRNGVLTSTTLLRQAAGLTPVVLLTGHVFRPEEAVAVGFRGLITKPFDVDCLLDQVRSIVPGRAVAVSDHQDAAAG